MALLCVHCLRIAVMVLLIGLRTAQGTLENCAFTRAIDDVNASYSCEDLSGVVMMMATSKALGWLQMQRIVCISRNREVDGMGDSWAAPMS